MTFGQLLVELEALKKNDPKLLEGDLVFQSEGEYFVTLAVTLPCRQLVLIPMMEDADAS
jgi:hypothetical protein